MLSNPINPVMPGTRYATAFETAGRFAHGVGGTATIGFGNNGMSMTCLALGDYGAGIFYLDYNGKIAFYDNNPFFTLALSMVNIAAAGNGGEYAFGIGDWATAGAAIAFTAKHFGFKIRLEAGVWNVYATQADGVTEKAQLLTTVVNADTLELLCARVGSTIRYWFRKNGSVLSSVVVLSANIPAGASRTWRYVMYQPENATMQVTLHALEIGR